MIKVKALTDDSSHWYLVPNEEAEEFNKLISLICYANETDGGEKLIYEFEKKFSKYRTGGDLNLTQLYIDKF